MSGCSICAQNKKTGTAKTIWGSICWWAAPCQYCCRLGDAQCSKLSCARTVPEWQQAFLSFSPFALPSPALWLSQVWFCCSDKKYLSGQTTLVERCSLSSQLQDCVVSQQWYKLQCIISDSYSGRSLKQLATPTVKNQEKGIYECLCSASFLSFLSYSPGPQTRGWKHTLLGWVHPTK